MEILTWESQQMSSQSFASTIKPNELESTVLLCKKAISSKGGSKRRGRINLILYPTGNPDINVSLPKKPEYHVTALEPQGVPIPVVNIHHLNSLSQSH